jgi:hypothetical protein
VIPEPQRMYVLEFLHALGPAADEFVRVDCLWFALTLLQGLTPAVPR